MADNEKKDKKPDVEQGNTANVPSEPEKSAVFDVHSLFNQQYSGTGSRSQAPKAEPQKEINLSEVSIPPFLKKPFEFFSLHKNYVIYIILLIILAAAVAPRLYTANYDTLYTTDSYWQYRHAAEILDHGYPGTEIRDLAPNERSICWREPACTFDRKQIYWDTLHDAPAGSAAPVELYQYFAAYSYKYFAKFLFPTLLDWIKITPILLILLATVVIFLLGRETLNDIAGLAAAFIFTFSVLIVTRSTYGYSDSDAIILLFAALTILLSFKAWSKKSYLFAIGGGISLGLLGFASASSFVFLPMFLGASAVVYFFYRFAVKLKETRNSTAASAPSGKQPGIFGIFKQTISDDYKGYLLLLIIIGIGLVLLAIFESPNHANIFQSAFNLLQVKAGERNVAAGVRNVFLTVEELRGLGVRGAIYGMHISLFVLVLIFAFSIPSKSKKPILKQPFYLMFLAIFFLVMFFATTKAIRSAIFLLIPASLFGGFALNDMLGKLSFRKPLASALIILFIISLFSFLPNISLKEDAGQEYIRNSFITLPFEIGSLDYDAMVHDNPPSFLEFYDWARGSTNKNDIFLSWWDHGHEVTAIAERPVVVDGSQNFQHVSDVARFFITTNVTEALSILQKYNVTYVFTSSDLFGKYGSISYVATGIMNGQSVSPLSNTYSLQNNTTNYVYLIGGTSAQLVVTVDKNGDANAVIIAKYNTTKIGRFYYSTTPTEEQIVRKSNENDTGNFANITLYFTPGYGYVVPLSNDVENSMFVRLHLFEGMGLEDNFKLVKNFNTVVKVYKVIY